MIEPHDGRINPRTITRMMQPEQWNRQPNDPSRVIDPSNSLVVKKEKKWKKFRKYLSNKKVKRA